MHCQPPTKKGSCKPDEHIEESCSVYTKLSEGGNQNRKDWFAPMIEQHIRIFPSPVGQFKMRKMITSTETIFGGQDYKRKYDQK